MLDAQDLATAIHKLQGRRSNQELAAQVGVAPATWSRWRSGLARPSLTSLSRIAEALGISEEDFAAELLRATAQRRRGAQAPEVRVAEAATGYGEDAGHREQWILERLAAIRQVCREIEEALVSGEP